jgi:signal transduction histidine kinase
MELQYRLFLLLAPLSAVAMLAMLAYAYRYRSSSRAQVDALARLVATLFGWLAFNFLELVAPTPQATLLWAQLTYLFIAASVVAWLGFALRYAGSERWLAPWRFAWLAAIPALTALLALTNQWHHLVWQEYEFVRVDGLLAMRVTDYGVWFRVQTSYAYLAVLAGALLISRQSLRAFRLYRRQSTLILAGALVPLVANFIYLFHLVPGLSKDYTSISFALAAIAFALGISRYRLFDLGPVAWRSIMDQMADAMITLDALGRVVDLNSAARRLMSGLDPQAKDGNWIGKPVAQLPAPWPDLVGDSPGDADRKTEVAFDLEGSRRYYDVRISPLVERRGRLAGRIVVLRNVTARRQAEEQLRAYAEELEVQNKELDAFAHMVAHDLKNPVAVLISYAEWMEEKHSEVSPDEILQALTEMVKIGYKITDMIDELLLLARLRRLEEIDLEPLDVGRILAAARARLGSEQAASQAHVVAPDTWPAVRGYAPWVEEVWTNYLSNAFKYGGNPQEGQPPLVELGFDQPAGSDGAHVRFWVRDNGPGLTAAEQALLFTEFTRLAQTRAQGHGLGLAIVRRIVERLGGEVGVESQPGKGSTFWFTLPRQPSWDSEPDLL